MKKLNWRTLVKIEEASGVSEDSIADIMKAAKQARVELQYNPIDDDRSAELWGDIWCILSDTLKE